MDTLTVVERFEAICGEGSEIGLRAYFIRLAGCNMPSRCRGWPCDTPHSWDAWHKDEWEKVSAEALAEDAAEHYRLFITGGEPLLQAKALEVMLKAYCGWRSGEGQEVILQTNGTLFEPAVLEWVDLLSIDIKTPGSGESPSSDIVEENLRFAYLNALQTQVKMLITSEEDYRFAKGWADRVYQTNSKTEIILGAANRRPIQPIGIKELADTLRTQRGWVERFVEDRGWPPTVRFLPQYHLLLFGNRRGV